MLSSHGKHTPNYIIMGVFSLQLISGSFVQPINHYYMSHLIQVFEAS